MNGSDAPVAAKRRVRKKRKIGTKKVRSKDERGYTVTKTVDEYESYSSEESDAPVVTGSKRAAASSAKQKSAAESRSTSTSASASPAPSAPAPTSAKSTPANSAAAKKASGATPTPAKKGQQSLNSFFTRKPKDK
jgi:DNA polymerase delta subunit 3